MKPKISTGYLTPQAKKTKNAVRSRLSDTEENAEPGIDKNIFEALMKCPEKKKMVLQLLAANKDAIEKYKKKEAKHTAPSPVGKLKNKRAACESPTALLRRRALEQMNTSSSSSNRSHSKFSEASSDHSESPIPFEKLLAGVVAYVEIKNRDQDRSSGVKVVLESMGAKIREKFSNDVTHVVFKDGSFLTYQKAKLMKIHLVSILWVDFCRKTMRRQPESLYPALKSGFQDNDTTMICSQMQKEYEDIVRDEYRKSIIEGTPLPTTRSLIDRRRTLMTPSVSSSFHTATENMSSQELLDHEVATINSVKDIDQESLILNDPELFSEVSGPMVNGSTVEKTNNVARNILQSMENVDASDMELTEIHNSKSLITGNFTPQKWRSKNDSDMELTRIVNSEKTPKPKAAKIDIYNQKTPKLGATKIPNALFNRRKTICNSMISSDNSTTSHISSDKTTNSSLLSSDKSTNVSENIPFAVPQVSPEKKSKRSSNNLSSNESFQFGKNTAKSSKAFPAKPIQTILAMSELNFSSDKNVSKTSSTMSDLHVSSENKQSKESNSDSRRSNLRVSSEQNTKEKPSERSTSMSTLHLSSERENSLNVKKSSKSSLNGYSENQGKSADRVSMSPLQVSTESKRSLTRRSKNNEQSSMSALLVSSEDNKITANQSSMSVQVSKKSKDSWEKNNKPNKNSLSVSNPSLMSSLHLSTERRSSNSSLGHSKKTSNKNLSFSSLDESNSEPFKNVVEDVIKNLGTPESVTVRKNFNQISASVSNASITSDDSEVLSPRRDFRKKSFRQSFRRKGIMDDSSDKDLSKNEELELLSSVTKRRRKTLGSRVTKKTVAEASTGDSVEVDKVLVVNIVKSPKIQIDKIYETNCTTSVKTRRMTMGQKELDKNENSGIKSVLTDRKISTRKKSGDKKTQERSVSNSASSGSEKGKTKSDDSCDSSKSRKYRKLYNPDDSIHVLIDDEQEREQGRLEVRKRKSNVGVYINPATVLKSPNKNLQNLKSDSESEENEESPPKRAKKGKGKNDLKRVSLNSSADEQKELLNEVINRKTKATSTTQPPKSDIKSNLKVKGSTSKFKTPTQTATRRKSLRTNKSSQKPLEPRKLEFPITPVNRRSTLDFQPASSSKKPKKLDKTKLPTIVCTKLHKPEVQVFAQIVKKLGRFVVEDEVTNRTTHLIAGEPKRTINMLRAISRGCWVLKYDWVLKSLENGKWLREEDFEVHDFSPSVQKCRLERQAFGPTYTLDVFDSCPGIYVAPSTNPRCSDLKELITICRGKVVTAPRMAKIIVGEYISQEGTVCVNETWVLDCITFNKKISFKRQYLLTEEAKEKRKSLVV